MTQEMLRPRKINSQGIVFTLTQTYREILKPALVSVPLITCKTFFGMLASHKKCMCMYIYLYIYVYICVCMCVCVCVHSFNVLSPYWKVTTCL